MSREKQIEEMSGFVGQSINHNCWLSDEQMEEIDMKGIAEELYDAGYRKQSEGEWVDQYQGMYVNQLYKCSVCGETAFHDDKRWFITNYCPNCGAKMKGGAEE